MRVDPPKRHWEDKSARNGLAERMRIVLVGVHRHKRSDYVNASSESLEARWLGYEERAYSDDEEHTSPARREKA